VPNKDNSHGCNLKSFFVDLCESSPNYMKFYNVMKAFLHVALWWHVWWMNLTLPHVQLLHPSPLFTTLCGLSNIHTFWCWWKLAFCSPLCSQNVAFSHCVSLKQWHSLYSCIPSSQTVRLPPVEPQINILCNNINVLVTSGTEPLKSNKELSHSYVHPSPLPSFLPYHYLLPSFPITTVS
jgi:hypothetical protein